MSGERKTAAEFCCCTISVLPLHAAETRNQQNGEAGVSRGGFQGEPGGSGGGVGKVSRPWASRPTETRAAASAKRGSARRNRAGAVEAEWASGRGKRSKCSRKKIMRARRPAGISRGSRDGDCRITRDEEREEHAGEESAQREFGGLDEGEASGSGFCRTWLRSEPAGALTAGETEGVEPGAEGGIGEVQIAAVLVQLDWRPRYMRVPTKQTPRRSRGS